MPKQIWRGTLTLAVVAGLACGTRNAAAQNRSWLLPTSGNWGDTANWSDGNVPDSQQEGARFEVTGLYTATLNGSYIVGPLTILNPGTTLSFPTARTLEVRGASMVNNGLIRLNESGGPTDTWISFSSIRPSTLSGSGRLVLNASSTLTSAALYTGTLLTHKAGHTISGTGYISGNDLVNESLIHADVAGKEIKIGIDVLQNGGELRADPGTISLSALVTGGTVTAANGGRLILGALKDLVANGPMLVRDNTSGSIDGIVNNGTIQVNEFGVSPTYLSASGTLSGSGSILLSPRVNLTSAQLTGTFTHLSTHTIRGGGIISGTIENQGTIRATDPVLPLEIRASLTQTGQGTIIAETGDIALGEGGALRGGEISISPGRKIRVTGRASVGGLHSEGQIFIENAASLGLLTGGLVHDGTITVNGADGTNTAALALEVPSTLSGSGSVELNASNNLASATIGGWPGGQLTLGESYRIRGTGVVSIPIVNNGVIGCDRAGRTLEIKSTVTQGPTGVITAGEGAITQLGLNTSVTGGTLGPDLGGVIRTSGLISLGSLAVTGNLEIGAGSRVRVLSGRLLNSGSIVVNSTEGTGFSEITGMSGAGLDGGGRVVLNASDNLDTAALRGSLTNESSHTITGDGSIYATVVNRGMIRGSESDSGAILSIAGRITQEGTGHIAASASGLGDILLFGGSITGGTLRGGVGKIRALGTQGSMTNVTNEAEISVHTNTSLQLEQFTNNGLLTVNFDSGTAASTVQLVNTAGLLPRIDGIGEIRLNAGTALSWAAIRAGATGVACEIGSGQRVTGRGRIYGPFNFQGTMAPGDEGTPDQLYLSGGIMLGSDAGVEIDALGVGAGQFDRLSGVGEFALAGTLRLNIAGWASAGCGSIAFIDGPTTTDVFDRVMVQGTTPPAGKVWRIRYEPSRVSLVATCPADLSGDCQVDDADFVTFARDYAEFSCGTVPSGQPDPCPSDLSGDGYVDDQDFVIFAGAYDGFVCGG